MVTNQQTGLRAILQDNQYARFTIKLTSARRYLPTGLFFPPPHSSAHKRQRHLVQKRYWKQSPHLWKYLPTDRNTSSPIPGVARHFFQATENHTFRQISCGKRSIIKCVIYHKIKEVLIFGTSHLNTSYGLTGIAKRFKFKPKSGSKYLLTSVYLYFSILRVGNPSRSKSANADARGHSALRHYAYRSSLPSVRKVLYIVVQPS